MQALTFDGTRKLYYDDAYATEFTARVISAEQLSPDDQGLISAKRLDPDDQDVNKTEELRVTSDKGPALWNIVLDQTLFFPEEGGQSADRGVISLTDEPAKAGRSDAFEVIDVQIRDGVITQTVCVPAKGSDRSVSEAAGNHSGNAAAGNHSGSEAAGDRPASAAAGDRADDAAGDSEAILFPGQEVSGRIDWAHRFSNMQQHSGEHLFSGIAHAKFGCENVGFRLSDSEVTLDFDLPLSDSQVAEVEAAVNEAITKNVESRVLFPTKEEETGLTYRSKIEIAGQVRLVEFPGYDLCACCAPHVRQTGEIGLMKVMMTQNYKGGVRVSILCGKRAFEALKKEHGLITGIGRSLSTSLDEIPAQITRFKDEIASLKMSLKEAQGKLLESQTSSLPADAPKVVLFADGAETKVVRDLVNELVKEHPDMSAVFTGNDDDGYSFIIGSASGQAQEACAKLREAFKARGGGQPAMTQGSVKASADEIRKALM